MAGSIARTVQQIKGDLGSIVAASQIVRLCQATGHAWRDRTLGPVETVYLFIALSYHQPHKACVRQSVHALNT